MIGTGERQRAMSTDPLGNIGYVTRLWRAFESGGVAAMAALIPPDVTWRPTAANGRALLGTDALDEFWSSREVVMPKLRMFHGRGDDVFVEAEYERDDGSVRTVWLLYGFNGATLLEAIAFPDEADGPICHLLLRQRGALQPAGSSSGGQATLARRQEPTYSSA
jgi:hypothetical protein